MSTKPPGKWPHYAEWHRCEAIAQMQRVKALTREAQVLLKGGDVVAAVLLLGDVRSAAEDAQRELERAKNGER
jgi:hypothetical protein